MFTQLSLRRYGTARTDSGLGLIVSMRSWRGGSALLPDRDQRNFQAEGGRRARPGGHVRLGHPRRALPAESPATGCCGARNEAASCPSSSASSTDPTSRRHRHRRLCAVVLFRSALAYFEGMSAAPPASPAPAANPPACATSPETGFARSPVSAIDRASATVSVHRQHNLPDCMAGSRGALPAMSRQRRGLGLRADEHPSSRSARGRIPGAPAISSRSRVNIVPVTVPRIAMRPLVRAPASRPAQDQTDPAQRVCTDTNWRNSPAAPCAEDGRSQTVPTGDLQGEVIAVVDDRCHTHRSRVVDSLGSARRWQPWRPAARDLHRDGATPPAPPTMKIGREGASGRCPVVPNMPSRRQRRGWDGSRGLERATPLVPDDAASTAATYSA